MRIGLPILVVCVLQQFFNGKRSIIVPKSTMIDSKNAIN